jgi:hypothetical protein
MLWNKIQMWTAKLCREDNKINPKDILIGTGLAIEYYSSRYNHIPILRSEE